LLELYRLATFDPVHVFDDKGQLKNISEIPEDARRCISSIDNYVESNDEGTKSTQKVKFWDKTKALEMLAKYFKLLTERIEVTDNSSLAERLIRARKRIGKE